MTLKAYKEKRNFNKTPEPSGKIKPASNELPKFVIQKHDASRLHYDLRLEAEGVLKSWAVPKGPSQNPKDKRLAMMVEDHPFDYFDFEGIIPKGNYGAGTVMVWDWGNFLLKDESDPKKIQKAVVKGINEGKLHIIFNGNKIKGEFALIKTKKESNEWLLFKINDDYVSESNYNDDDKSVKTERSLTEIKNTAQQNDELWYSPPDLSKINFKEAKKKSMPHQVRPMLATPVPNSFDNEDWIFELKWDGYRCIAEVDNGKVEIYSRNLKSFNNKFQLIYEALKRIPFKAILDGEIVIVDENGKSDFNALQNYQTTGKGNLVYYVFDILYLKEFDLTSIPLVKRKEILEEILPPIKNIRYSDHISAHGKEFFDLAVNMELEGIIGKCKQSLYYIGQRSKDWVKIKTQKRLEAVICGFTKPRGGRKYFGALILGSFVNGELTYIGHTGGGFTNKNLKTLYERLDQIKIANHPFKKKPVTNMPVTWVKPELVCEVKYLEFTKENILRNPVFLGLREDKDVEDLLNEPEIELATGKEEESNKVSSKKKNVVKKQTKKTISEFNEPDELLNSKKEEGTLIVDGNKLKLTNINKIYWPEEGYTKGDLIKYYFDIADIILPHLIDRPESLHRYPNGIYGESFYQKDMKESLPNWIETIKIKSESGNRKINYLLCQNKATLIYLANYGCIELNPWSSRINKLDYPDYTIIDIDPPDKVIFDDVIEVAQNVKQVLDECDIKGYVKTSGSSGLHILIPLNAKYSYEQARNFALLIGTVVHQRLKKITSLERLTKKRNNKIYIDCLQNYSGQTIASAYCVRPRAHATVSTPLEWNELVKGKLLPSNFTIKNFTERVKKRGDILKGLYKEQNDIEAALEKLENLF